MIMIFLLKLLISVMVGITFKMISNTFFSGWFAVCTFLSICYLIDIVIKLN